MPLWNEIIWVYGRPHLKRTMIYFSSFYRNQALNIHTLEVEKLVKNRKTMLQFLSLSRYLRSFSRYSSSKHNFLSWGRFEDILNSCVNDSGFIIEKLARFWFFWWYEIPSKFFVKMENMDLPSIFNILYENCFDGIQSGMLLGYHSMIYHRKK